MMANQEDSSSDPVPPLAPPPAPPPTPATAAALAAAPRRSSRARRLNSRFDNDEVDEGFRQLVARINAPDSHSILQSPELAFHRPNPTPAPVPPSPVLPLQQKKNSDTDTAEPSVSSAKKLATISAVKKLTKKVRRISQDSECSENSIKLEKRTKLTNKKLKLQLKKLNVNHIKNSGAKAESDSDFEDDIPLAKFSNQCPTRSSDSSDDDSPVPKNSGKEDSCSEDYKCGLPGNYSIKTIHHPELSSTPISIVCIEDPEPEADRTTPVKKGKRKSFVKMFNVAKKGKTDVNSALGKKKKVSVANELGNESKSKIGQKSIMTKKGKKNGNKMENTKAKVPLDPTQGKLLKIINLKVVPNSLNELSNNPLRKLMEKTSPVASSSESSVQNNTIKLAKFHPETPKSTSSQVSDTSSEDLERISQPASATAEQFTIAKEVKSLNQNEEGRNALHTGESENKPQDQSVGENLKLEHMSLLDKSAMYSELASILEPETLNNEKLSVTVDSPLKSNFSTSSESEAIQHSLELSANEFFSKPEKMTSETECLLKSGTSHPSSSPSTMKESASSDEVENITSVNQEILSKHALSTHDSSTPISNTEKSSKKQKLHNDDSVVKNCNKEAMNQVERADESQKSKIDQKYDEHHQKSDMSQEEASTDDKKIKCKRRNEEPLSSSNKKLKQEIDDSSCKAKTSPIKYSLENVLIQTQSNSASVGGHLKSEEVHSDVLRTKVAKTSSSNSTNIATFIPVKEDPYEEKPDLAMVRDTREQEEGDDKSKILHKRSFESKSVRSSHKQEDKLESCNKQKSKTRETSGERKDSKEKSKSKSVLQNCDTTIDSIDRTGHKEMNPKVDLKTSHPESVPFDSKPDIKPALLVTKIIDGTGIESKHSLNKELSSSPTSNKIESNNNASSEKNIESPKNVSKHSKGNEKNLSGTSSVAFVKKEPEDVVTENEESTPSTPRNLKCENRSPDNVSASESRSISISLKKSKDSSRRTSSRDSDSKSPSDRKNSASSKDRHHRNDSSSRSSSSRSSHRSSSHRSRHHEESKDRRRDSSSSKSSRRDKDRDRKDHRQSESIDSQKTDKVLEDFIVPNTTTAVQDSPVSSKIPASKQFRAADLELSEILNLEQSKISDKGLNRKLDLGPRKSSDLCENQSSDLYQNKSSDQGLSEKSNLDSTVKSDLGLSEKSDMAESEKSDMGLSKTSDMVLREPSDLVPSELSDMVPSELSDVIPSQSSDMVPSKASDMVPSKASDMVLSKTSGMKQSKSSGEDIITEDSDCMKSVRMKGVKTEDSSNHKSAFLQKSQPSLQNCVSESVDAMALVDIKVNTTVPPVGKTSSVTARSLSSISATKAALPVALSISPVTELLNMCRANIRSSSNSSDINSQSSNDNSMDATNFPSINSLGFMNSKAEQPLMKSHELNPKTEINLKSEIVVNSVYSAISSRNAGSLKLENGLDHSPQGSAREDTVSGTDSKTNYHKRVRDLVSSSSDSDSDEDNNRLSNSESSRPLKRSNLAKSEHPSSTELDKLSEKDVKSSVRFDMMNDVNGQLPTSDLVSLPHKSDLSLDEISCSSAPDSLSQTVDAKQTLGSAQNVTESAPVKKRIEDGEQQITKVQVEAAQEEKTPLEDALPEVHKEETEEEKQQRELEKAQADAAREAHNKAVVEERLKSFVHLTENLYLIDRKKSKQSKEVRRMVCDCTLTKEELAKGEKGCLDDCLNRLLMIECGWRCPLGNACLNRQFQNCQYGPVEVFNAEQKGCGVQAVEDIPPGTFIMEYVGEVFDQREFRRRRKDYGKDGTAHFYFMALKADQFIDATRKGNISRFVNHSCDPNAETQKWTVNGDLRIGFFSTKTIKAGEEINFDYRMERYGREPQKCYCGTAVCRGWLGEPPEEKTKEEKEEEKKKLSADKRKKDDKKQYDDELQDDLSELRRVGMRNRQYTLLLSRVMVRAESEHTRTQLLLLLCGARSNTPCLRLFMDYHGLSLLWSWMADLTTHLENAPLKLQILKTLDILPITYRTQVEDSRVLEMVEKWSKQSPPAASGDSVTPPAATSTPTTVPASQPTSTTDNKKSSDTSEDSDEVTTDECSQDSVDPKASSKPPQQQQGSDDNSNSSSDSNSGDKTKESPSDDPQQPPPPQSRETTPDRQLPAAPSQDEVLRKVQLEMVELAAALVTRWQQLPEEFRIPKKQRVKLMREHEREVEAGYKRYLDTERGRREMMERHSSNRRDSYYDSWRNKIALVDHDSSARRGSWPAKDSSINDAEFAGLSKEERREKFAQKVAIEDEQRRLQEGMWTVHVERCARSGLDPYQSPIVDPSGQYYWDSSNSTWVPLTHHTAYAAGLLEPGLEHQQPMDDGDCYNNAAAIEALSPHVIPVANGEVLPPVVVTISLPPHWHMARDQHNRLYFYHSRSRQTQWDIPTLETKTTLQYETDSESDSDSSSSSDSEEEFSSDDGGGPDDEASQASTEGEAAADEPETMEGKIIRRQRGKKKHSDALVQQRVISPIREMDREQARRERREAKDRARHEARKERLQQTLLLEPGDEDDELAGDEYDPAAAGEEMTKAKIAVPHPPREKVKTKSKERAATAIADTSEKARKIKDQFRSRIATFIVSVLNPYRRSDCKQGRINTTEDFKYLARKLTHFVMVKELKQLPSIEGLDCSSSVKHKTKDFVRKYMAKFESSFKRDPLDTKEY